MNINDLLPWLSVLNVLLVPIANSLMDINRRLTRLEALREADDNQRKAAAAVRAPA